MEFTEFIIAAISILSAVALPIVTGLVIGIILMKNRHKEKMGLISQGIIPPTTAREKANPNRMVALRNGIVLIGVGIGLVVGFVLAQYVLSDSDDFRFWVVAASVVLFLGLSYVVYFLLTRNMPEEPERDIVE